jgi:hypothetical protein
VALTRRQIAFVEHYLQCRNATEAARRAGYSLRSARELAHRNMENLDVQAEIKARFEEATQLTTDEVLQRLVDQARGDIGVFFQVVEFWTIEEPLPTYEIVRTRVLVDENGNKLPQYLLRRVQIDTAKLVDPKYAHLVRKYADSPKNGLSIELYDAQSALQLVGKTLGMFKDGAAAEVNVNILDLEAWKRQREERRAELEALDDGDGECAPADAQS